MTSVPEITAQQLSEMLNAEEGFVLLDVREPFEVTRAKWNDERVVYVRMNELAQRGVEALSGLSEARPLVVACHHGIRSYQVVHWLAAQGWEQVFSLRGGIEAYAMEVDASVGRY